MTSFDSIRKKHQTLAQKLFPETLSRVNWSKEDLKLNPIRIGLNGSPTWVRKTFVHRHSRDGIVVEKPAANSAEDILDFILEKALLKLYGCHFATYGFTRPNGGCGRRIEYACYSP